MTGRTREEGSRTDARIRALPQDHEVRARRHLDELVGGAGLRPSECSVVAGGPPRLCRMLHDGRPDRRPVLVRRSHRHVESPYARCEVGEEMGEREDLLVGPARRQAHGQLRLSIDHQVVPRHRDCLRREDDAVCEA